MSSVLSAISWFWVTYGPWIGAALIPTIITGLSLAPQTAGATGIVTKVWNYLKVLMGLFSVATPKDAPGTFQLPLKMGRLRKKSGPAVGLVLIIFLTSSTTQVSCAWWHKHSAEVEEVAINCGVTALRDAGQSLLPAVLAILTGGSINWQEQINAFGKQFGQDAVACALEFASSKLMAEHPMGAGSGSGDSKGMEGVNKARLYLNSHHITVKE